ncbi:Sau3AI family type II restriction endonuclease [Empedobacter brevis]|uniref:Sau3AI family type II restriction endonuclease n=1 Tax=Empedobacter brevis TaxID=247 RepID=UPI00334221E6
MNINYDSRNKDSILAYANQLKNKTLNELVKFEEDFLGYGGKGKFGQLLEKYYFGYDINSDSESDFKEVGMELKSSPLKQLKNKEYRAKERLVLNIINYQEIVEENFENSKFWNKNACLLLIFYLHETEKLPIDYLIKLIGEWKFEDEDLEIIKADWHKIVDKIKSGKAHELSEGDTFYLGACTKGANASSVREQPFSNIRAKQRAFSFKQGYVNHIIAKISGKEKGFGKLIKSDEEIKNKTIDEIVIESFKSYYGDTVDEISRKTGVKLDFIDSKNFYSKVTHAILNIELNKEIEEFEKADIQIKTIRVEPNNNIIQSVSFPAFEFTQLYKESWINCEMKDITEKKYLFIFFKRINDQYVLDKVKFWNMPLSDRNEVRKVWLQTKKIIQEGNIFKEYDKNKDGSIRLSIKGNPIRLNNLPKMSENLVCHVRPHGADSTKTFPLPVEDKILKVKEYSKQCFWYNNTYVRDEIYLK